MPYLIQQQKYGYVEWPIQPWYQEGVKRFYCPLGKINVELCDEPQFSVTTRFFLLGRQFLDEKDLLYDIVPELMPPTFHTIEDAKTYAVDAATIATSSSSSNNAEEGQDHQDDHKKLLWFLKKVNQNGGRAVTVLHELPSTLEKDEQLQVHIPRPLLWSEKKLKCHVKTYYYLSTVGYCQQPEVALAARPDDDTAAMKVEWNLYIHDLYYLAIASKPWNINDLSDECQITTMRLQRLYKDHPWRERWNLTELCTKHLVTTMTRAIQQDKLKVPPTTTAAASSTTKANSQNDEQVTTLQFEINSADWMLDEDGRIYLIECNGIPVLYDPKQSQPLCTKGLQLYDSLYKQDPDNAVVNDHDLIKDAVDLTMTGKLPQNSLWKQIATIPANN